MFVFEPDSCSCKRGASHLTRPHPVAFKQHNTLWRTHAHRQSGPCTGLPLQSIRRASLPA